MKKITQALELQLTALEDLIFEREETFSIRSEYWKGSPKGESYQYDTEEIRCQSEELKAIIDNLKEL